MEPTEIAGYFGALAVGVVLGLLGGGGSLMAVPIFSYLFQLNPVTATAYSLFVVGTTAAGGALRYLRRGLVHWHAVGWFGVPTMITVFLVRRLLIHRIPAHLELGGWVLGRDQALMLLFSAILVTAAFGLLRAPEGTQETRKKGHVRPLLLVVTGLAIGLLTGLAGIGGGFLIVPVLILFAGLPMVRAVSTSLCIVSANALIGFAGNLGKLDMDWEFLFGFTAIATVGILIGTALSQRIPSGRLRAVFGWICLAVAGYILYREMLA